MDPVNPILYRQTERLSRYLNEGWAQLCEYWDDPDSLRQFPEVQRAECEEVWRRTANLTISAMVESWQRHHLDVPDIHHGYDSDRIAAWELRWRTGPYEAFKIRVEKDRIRYAHGEFFRMDQRTDPRTPEEWDTFGKDVQTIGGALSALVALKRGSTLL